MHEPTPASPNASATTWNRGRSLTRTGATWCCAPTCWLVCSPSWSRRCPRCVRWVARCSAKAWAACRPTRACSFEGQGAFELFAASVSSA